MSGFTLRQTPTSPVIREWFGTSGDDSGLGLEAASGVLGSQDIAYGYQGNDTIDVGFSPSSQVYGGQGNDSLVGSPVFIAITRLFGNLGNDTIIMNGGVASFGSGNQGDDSLVGSNGGTIDSLWGGQGNDVLRGLDGSDFLSGDLGQDIIWGDDGAGAANANHNDIILGGGESDTIVGGGGNDSIRGGQGDDYIEVDAALVNTTSNGVTTTRIPTGGDVVSGNDTVWGDAGNDTIGRETSTGNEVYSGGDGNDSVVGGVGNDSITGDAGDDIIRGGNDGRDTITGGVGNDSIQGGNESATLFNPDANPSQTIGTTYIITDSLVGAEGDDTINGNTGTDFIDGGIGKDSLLGGDHADIILGGDQADTLRGEDGADSLVGGRDNDLLEGGQRSDTLTGGLTGDTPASNTPGEDIFRYSITSLVSFLGTGLVDVTNGIGNAGNPTGKLPDADLITDFQVASDRIEVVEATTTVAAPVAPATVPAGTYNFGGTFGGFGTATFSQIGFVAGGGALTTVGSIGGLTANDAIVYIEASAVAANTGFQANEDVVLAVLKDVGGAAGVTATTLTSSNFI